MTDASTLHALRAQVYYGLSSNFRILL